MNLIKNKTRLEKMYDYLKKNNSEECLNIIKYLDKKNGLFSIDDDLLVDIISIIIETNYKYRIDDAIKLYNVVVYNKNNEEQKNLFLKLFRVISLNKYIHISTFFDIYSLFENKELILNFVNYLNNIGDINYDALSIYCNEYLLVARRYYVDENAFYSSAIQVLNKVVSEGINFNNIKNIIKCEINNDKHLAGIYKIDEEKIEIISKKINELENKQDDINLKIEDSINYIDNVFNNMDVRIKEEEKHSLEKLVELKKLLNEAKNVLNFKGENHASKQEEVIKDVKDSKEVNKYLNELLKIKESAGINIYEKDYENSLDNVLNYYDENHASKQEKVIKDVKDSREENRYLNELSKIKKWADNDTSIYDEEFLNYLKRYTIKDIKNDNKYFKFYYIALINEQLDLFNELTHIYPISDFERYWFNKDVINIFGKEMFSNVLVNNKDLLWAYYGEIRINDKLKSLKNLKQLLEKNPNFKCMFDAFKCEIAIEVFGIDKIANNDEVVANLVDRIDSEEVLKKYKEVYDINPNINIKDCIFFDKRIFKLFTVKEIANFTIEQQDRISNIVKGYNIGTMPFYKNINAVLRKLIFAETNAKFDSYVIDLLYSEFNITIEQFLSLDENQSELLLKEYGLYCSRCRKRQDVKKTLKTIKKEKKKRER